MARGRGAGRAPLLVVGNACDATGSRAVLSGSFTTGAQWLWLWLTFPAAPRRAFPAPISVPRKAPQTQDVTCGLFSSAWWPRPWAVWNSLVPVSSVCLVFPLPLPPSFLSRRPWPSRDTEAATAGLCTAGGGGFLCARSAAWAWCVCAPAGGDPPCAGPAHRLGGFPCARRVHYKGQWGRLTPVPSRQPQDGPLNGHQVLAGSGG